jgi:hypothetical protein
MAAALRADAAAAMDEGGSDEEDEEEEETEDSGDVAERRGNRHSGTTPFSPRISSTRGIEKELSGSYHDSTRGTSGAASALLLLSLLDDDDDDSAV